MSKTEGGTNPLQPSNAADPRRTVTEFLGAFAEGHWEKPQYVLRHLAEDAEWWVAGTTRVSGTFTKSQMMKSLHNVAALAAGGLTITPVAWIIEGEKVAVEAQSVMKLKDGREYRNQYHFAFEVRDHKIHRIWEYMDTAHIVALFGE